MHYQKGRDKGSLLLLGNDSRLLILSFILFIITVSYNTSVYSAKGTAIDVAFSAVAALYVISYGLSGRSESFSIASSILFMLSLLLFVAGTWLHIGLGQLSMHDFSELEYLVAYLVIFLLIFAIIQIFFYIKDWRVRSIISIVVVLLLVLYFIPSTTSYMVDDEVLLSYYGIKALAAGTNPYSINIAQQIYILLQHSRIGFTASTNGTIMGLMDYPSLYFLIQIPFYVLIRQPPQQLSGNFMHTEGFVFTLILLMSYVIFEGKKRYAQPNYAFYIALGLFSIYMPSMIIILMLAVVIMLYSTAADKYEWLILGIAVSLQEQLWFMALLFIAYSFNVHGKKAGVRNLALTFAVFMVFNGYFILTDPSGYAGNFLAVTGTILPNSLSPIGYAIAVHIGVLLSAFNYLFAASMALVLLISLYVNNRQLLPLLSAIPFLFLGHATQIYYILPVAVLALVADPVSKDTMKNLLSSTISKDRNLKIAYLLSISAILLAMVLIILQSHRSYESTLNLSATGIGISYINSTHLAYGAVIHYNKGAAANLYLIMEANSNGSGRYYGLFNSSILSGSHRCAFPCAVNVNIVHLNGSGTYNLTAILPSNIPRPAYLSMILSNSQYYYQAPAIRYG